MRKRLSKLIIFSLILFGKILGNGSYEMLHFYSDSRSLSLNNSSSAYDSHMLRNNPAALSMNKEKISYSYFSIPAKINCIQIQRIKKNKTGMVAGKALLTNYGSIIDGEKTEPVNAYDAIIEIAYKQEFQHIISIGISGGYAINTISNYSSQLLFSKIGLRSRIKQKRVGIGISLENIGWIASSYTDYKEPLPTIFRSSIYFKPFLFPIIINCDFLHQINFNKIEYLIGFEFNENEKITYRFGFNNQRSNLLNNNFSSDFLTGISGGIGIKFKKYIVDIGFLNLGSAGSIIAFSIINPLN